MSARLRAAVIGLGQVAWRFDEEPARRTVWTHVGAYKALAQDFELVGACDFSAAARSAFASRHRDVAVFADIKAMIVETSPDVVSICTPNAAHRVALDAVLASGRPRVIWCEKPLAVSLADASAMVDACDQAQGLLVVSQVRRWSPLWQRFKTRIEAGEIGALRSLRVVMPNRLWSIGSHAVDLLLWLGGAVAATKAMHVPALDEGGEPAVSAILSFESGAAGILQVSGRKANLVVEAEATGDAGRLTLREDYGTVTFESFSPSLSYEGYRQFGPAAIDKVADEGYSPFVAIGREICGLVRGAITDPTCSGRAALATQVLLDQLAAVVTQPTQIKAATA